MLSAYHRKPPLPKKKRKTEKVKKERDFSLSCAPAKIPDYNALQDEHLGHFFRSRTVQRTLIEAGMVCCALRHSNPF
jgi:hypothetical protein